MDAITTFVDGEEDIFINLPTDYGKSLIYQYKLANVVTVIVSGSLFVALVEGSSARSLVIFVELVKEIIREVPVSSVASPVLSRSSGKRKDFATLRVSDTVSQISIQVVRSLVLSTTLFFLFNKFAQIYHNYLQ